MFEQIEDVVEPEMLDAALSLRIDRESQVLGSTLGRHRMAFLRKKYEERWEGGYQELLSRLGMEMKEGNG